MSNFVQFCTNINKLDATQTLFMYIAVILLIIMMFAVIAYIFITDDD